MICLNAHDRIKVRGYGKSMEPLIEEADVLLLTKAEEIEIGDILLYYIRNRYVVHRVIAISQKSIKLKGDNSLTSEVIPRRCVLGKIMMIYKNNIGYTYSNKCMSKLIGKASNRINEKYRKESEDGKISLAIECIVFEILKYCELLMMIITNFAKWIIENVKIH